MVVVASWKCPSYTTDGTRQSAMPRVCFYRNGQRAIRALCHGPARPNGMHTSPERFSCVLLYIVMARRVRATYTGTNGAGDGPDTPRHDVGEIPLSAC